MELKKKKTIKDHGKALKEHGKKLATDIKQTGAERMQIIADKVTHPPEIQDPGPPKEQQ